MMTTPMAIRAQSDSIRHLVCTVIGQVFNVVDFKEVQSIGLLEWSILTTTFADPICLFQHPGFDQRIA
ncbi:hypothetical protein D3C72_2298430 [compost metagenome]